MKFKISGSLCRSLTCVCLVGDFVSLYRGKSPLNHHLGEHVLLFQASNMQIQVNIILKISLYSTVISLGEIACFLIPMGSVYDMFTYMNG